MNHLANLDGRVAKFGDAHYERQRRRGCLNALVPTRYPDLIVQAQSEADITKALRHARHSNLKVTTRSGGHNTACAALRGSGVQIDVSYLDSLNINEERCTASFGPGLTSLDFLKAIETRNFAFPVAQYPTVTMGGYLLGGGLGWNKSSWGGLACNALENATVILGDGSKVNASANENADLFWALKGSGPGFFGVITRYKARLFSKPQLIWRQTYVHSLSNLEMIVRELDTCFDEEAKQLSVQISCNSAPKGLANQTARHGKHLEVHVSAFANDWEGAEALLSPFEKSRIASLCQRSSSNKFHRLTQLYSGVETSSGRSTGDNMFTNEVEPLLILVSKFINIPSPRSKIYCSYGCRLPQIDGSCFSTAGRHYLAAYLEWDDRTEDQIHFSWLDQTFAELDTFSKGHYLNEVDLARNPERIHKSFSHEKLRKIAELREVYDPHGIFFDQIDFH